MRASHIGHKAPLALDEAQPRSGRNVSQVGAKRELKTATECDAVNRGDHRDGHLSPCPDDVLDIIGNAVRAFGEIGKGQKAVAPGQRGDPLDVEPGAKGSAFAGQHHRTHGC